MKPAIKKKWLTALRGGKYLQGRENLLIEQDGKKKYCCLGVLCEVMGMKAERAREEEERDIFSYDSRTGELSDRLKKEAELTYYQAQELMGRNDGADEAEHFPISGRKSIKPQSFKQIALWIEKNC